MKRMLSLALAAMLAVGLSACSNPPKGPETTPNQGDSAVFGGVSGEAATPAPAAKSPEDAEIEAIERLLPGHEFRNMEAAELSALLDQLGGGFKGVGRTDGANSYALITLADGRPFSGANYGFAEGEPDYRYTCYEVSHADDTRTLEIAILKKDENGLESEEGLCSVRDVESIQFGPDGRFCYVIQKSADQKVTDAVMPGSRKVMIEAASRGLESTKPEGAYLALKLYDTKIRDNCGFSEPAHFYLPLTAEQYQTAEALIGAGFEAKGGKELKKLYPEMYETGVTLWLDGESYTQFSCGAFAIGSEQGYYPTHVSNGLSDWLREVAAPYFGCDPAGYEKSWFDQPLASATLTFHVSKGAEGYWNWTAQTQTITDEKALEQLAKLFKEAEFGSDSACPFGAPLTITRKDGETLTIFVAEDSCGTAMINGSIWCDYGRQDKLAEIFNEAMAGRE